MKIKLLTSLILALTTSHSFAGLQDSEIEAAYQDKNGNLIVRFQYQSKSLSSPETPDLFGLNRTFYGNENGLYQLKGTGFSGRMPIYHFSFFDPSQKEQRGHFYARIDPEDTTKETNSNLIVCDNSERDFSLVSEDLKSDLQQEIRDSQIPLNPLPRDARSSVYLFKSKTSDLYIYVDASKFNFSYESFRLFVGKLGEMKNLEITNVNRLRDGGTTHINLADGSKLFSPSALTQGKVATWTSREGTLELEDLSTQSFELETLGIKDVPSKDKLLKTPCEDAN